MINSYLYTQLLIKQIVTSERLNSQGVVAGHSRHAPVGTGAGAEAACVVCWAGWGPPLMAWVQAEPAS